MISYHENVDGMSQAMNNRRRAKYTKKEKLNDRHNVIDLTGMPKPNNTTGRQELRAAIGNSKPAFFTVPEDKGPDYDNMEDEYSKYDEMFDGQADQFLINSGATILRSEIEITDSQGRNRKLVRRDPTTITNKQSW